MEEFIEILGQLIHDSGIDNSDINDAIIILKESYSIITFPEVQEYMEKDWFNDEAILEVEGNFGSSAYFIPNKYLIK